MSGLKLYGDPMSPVVRSVMLFLAANGIPYEMVAVSIMKREFETNQELIAINPNKKMPALDDNGFKMFESCAILQYLSEKYPAPDHWYPKDLQARAKVNEALAWFPGNLRCGAFFHAAVAPRRFNRPVDEGKVAELSAILKKSLDIVENYFLKDGKFVGGMDEISIADVEFIGEVTQYWIADYDIYKGRPNMERWMAEVQKVLAPHFDQVYQPIYEVRRAGTLSGKLDL